jgi:hypothetical protein
MTYVQTVDLIESICNTVNASGTFIHGRRTDGSLAYPDPMPQIHLYPFITVPDLINGFDSSNIQMGFWQHGAAELSMAENKAKIAAADVMTRAFLVALNESRVDLSNIRMEPAYNMFPAILTGYMLTFTITSKTSSC